MEAGGRSQGSENDLIGSFLKLIFSVVWLRRTRERVGDSCKQDRAQGGHRAGDASAEVDWEVDCGAECGWTPRQARRGVSGRLESSSLLKVEFMRLGWGLMGQSLEFPGRELAGGQGWPIGAPCPRVVAAEGLVTGPRIRALHGAQEGGSGTPSPPRDRPSPAAR